VNPMLWMCVLAACAVAGAAAVALRSKASALVVKDHLRTLADRLIPLDHERALDRIVDEVLRAVSNQIRRGTQPRAITIMLGPVIFHTAAAGGDVGSVRSAVLGGLATMSTPILGDDAVSVAVKRNADLDPTKVTVAVSSRGVTPTPRPLRAGSRPKPQSPERPAPSLVTMRLKPLSAGMPEFTLVPGRELTIGRETCDLVLPESSGETYGTSRVHAMVFADFTGGRVQIRDNESLNHTYVNGQRVTAATLGHLDTLGLATAEWLLIIEGCS